MITFKHHGNFNSTEKFLNRKMDNLSSILNKYGKEGVTALSAATPSESGETARCWNYNIKISKYSYKITWTNSNIVDGVPIAIILQYGHATRNGGYVQGQDYINPALKPILDNLLDEIWREVTNL
jgi:hypothetical protein